MSFIVTLLLWAATYVLSEILKPKPNIENARPAGLGDFSFPTTTEERSVPLIWGTVKLSGPNVTWYGNLKQVAITHHIDPGMFSSTKEYTVGFKYKVGIQFALCRGPVDNIRRIWIGDDEVWSGEVSAGAIVIDKPKLFGGADLGNGGVEGTFNFLGGTAVQTPNTYLSAFQQEGGDSPAYRGTCYGVWERGYIGTSTTIKPWAFEVRRIPEGPGGLTRAVNSGNDANLAYVVYEILTNTEWGLGFPEVDVDTTNFNAVANTLQAEGNGFSFVLDSPREISALLEEVQRQMDGVVYLDQSSGKWVIKLARANYSVGSIPAINETNIVEVKDYVRGSWFDTKNYVTVQFKDRARDYFGTFALAQDMANYRIQGVSNKSNMVFPGVKDKTLANAIVWREIRVLSYPLAKATIVVNREFWDVGPADVLKWTSAKLGFTDLVMRVSRVDLGDLVNGRIELTLVQDVFALTVPAFGDPVDTGWTPPSTTAVAIPAADSIIMEAPRALSIRDPDALSNSLPFRVWGAARNQDDGSVWFHMRTRDGADAYELERTITQFMLIGKLSANLGEAITTSSMDIVPDPDSQSDILEEFTTVAVNVLGRELTQMIMVNNEFMLVYTAAAAGGNVRFTTVYRGVLDSAIENHATDDKVYLLSVGGGIGDRSWSNGVGIDIKFVPETPDEELAEGSATVLNVTFANRHLKPYCPIGFNCNGAGDYNVGDHNMDTGSGDGAGVTVAFDRRDYLEFQENARHISGDAAPSESSTKYRIAVYDETGAPSLLYTSAFNAGGASILIERTLILQAMGGSLPTDLRGEIQTQHTLSAVDYDALQDTVFSFGVNFSQLVDDFNLGVLSYNEISSVWTSVPDTGTYAFTIGTALTTGEVQGRINSGSWVPVILVTNTTGNLTGVTAGDNIEVRVSVTGLVVGGGRDETILRVDSPTSSVDAYGILEE